MPLKVMVVDSETSEVLDWQEVCQANDCQDLSCDLLHAEPSGTGMKIEVALLKAWIKDGREGA